MKIAKVITIFGDSITWGAWDHEGLGWANRLRKYLEEKSKKENIVYNLGICGDASVWLKERIDVECRGTDPDTIIIAIGINDSSCLSENKEKTLTPINKFENNLKELIEIARKYVDEIIFVGLTSVDEKLTSPFLESNRYYGNKKIIEYENVVEKISLQNKVGFIKINDLLNNEDLNDGLHPNSVGHEKIFKKVKDFLINNKII